MLTTHPTATPITNTSTAVTTSLTTANMIDFRLSCRFPEATVLRGRNGQLTHLAQVYEAVEGCLSVEVQDIPVSETDKIIEIAV